MTREYRRRGSLWTVELMNTKESTWEAMKHAKELVLLHKMRMLAPIRGLTVDSLITLEISLEELMAQTGIRNRNTLARMLDWLVAHGALQEKYHMDTNGLPVKRAGLYWLGRIVRNMRKVKTPAGNSRLLFGKAYVKWYELNLKRTPRIIFTTIE
jgi:hypothetical protein